MNANRNTKTEKDVRKRKLGACKAAAPALPPAEPDPVASYMMKTRGRLGASHRLDD